jgi:hypothetical protein
MNYSVFFFDGKRWRERSISYPVNINIGAASEIFFRAVRSILDFNNCAIIKPVLYQRVYRRGWTSDPDYDVAYMAQEAWK